MLRSRLRAAGTLTLAVGLVTAVVFGSIGHGGLAQVRFDLNGGAAWFSDMATGQLSLLDGSSATRVARVRVSAPGHRVEVVQSGSGAFVVDRSTGTVTRVDGARLTPGPAVPLGSAGDERLAVVSNARSTWVLTQQGTFAQEVDPVSLAPLGGPQPITDPESHAVLTSHGGLWTIGPSGVVRSFAAGRLLTRTTPGGPGSMLVAADGRAVVVDPAASSALILSGGGRVARRVAFDVPTSPPPTVSGDVGSPFLLAVGATTGSLTVTDLRVGRSASVIIGVPSSTTRYGQAVIKGPLAFVPDFVDGVVVVVRMDRAAPVVERRVNVGLAGVTFELLSHDNHVWFNDPGGDTAGVITDALGASAASKGATDGSGHPVGASSKAPPPSIAPPQPATATTATTTPSVTPPQPATATTATTPSPGTGQVPPTTTTPPSLTPAFSWNPSSGVVDHPVTFADTTAGPHAIFGWTFTQGSPSTSQASSPVVTWSALGTFTVTLTVTDPRGNAFSTQQQITVSATAATTTTTTTIPTTTTTTTIPPTTTTTTTTTPACSPTETSPMSYTSPGHSTFVVPPGVSSIKVVVLGAGGGANFSGSQAGGKGALVGETIPVAACATVQVSVGGKGQDGTASVGGAGGSSVDNFAGGNAGNSAGSGPPTSTVRLLDSGGGGGAASFVAPDAGGQTAVAGGGGGAGGNGEACFGGPGGGSGQQGSRTPCPPFNPGGAPGASPSPQGLPGADGSSGGGDGSGGGGGGGSAGGGGGTVVSLNGGGGGGGGTSLAQTSTKLIQEGNGSAGDGSVTITWTVSGAAAMPAHLLREQTDGPESAPVGALAFSGAGAVALVASAPERARRNRRRRRQSSQ